MTRLQDVPGKDLRLPNGPNDSWEEFLSGTHLIRGNVFDSLSRGFLTYEDRRFDLVSTDRVILLLISNAAKMPSTFLLNYPALTLRLLAPMALEALYANVHRTTRPRLLIVTKDIASREDFMKFKAGWQIIHDRFFPVGMIRTNGEIRDLSEVWIGPHEIPPSVLFTSSSGVLPSANILNQLFMMIVELDEKNPPQVFVDLLKLSGSHGIPSTVFITTNPFSDQSRSLLQSGIACWGWNSRLLGSTLTMDAKGAREWQPFSMIQRECLNAVEGTRRVIIPVDEPKLESLIEEVRKRQRDMAASAKRSGNDQLEILCNRLLSAIQAFEEMPAPIEYYEDEASRVWNTVTIEARFRGLERGVRDLERFDPANASYFSQTISVLKDIAKGTRTSRAGKPTALLRVIDAILDKKASAVLVVRNRASRIATENFLRDSGRSVGFLLEHSINVMTCSDLPEHQGAQIALFTTLSPFQKNLLRCLRFRTQAFLLYKSQVPFVHGLIASTDSFMEERFAISNQVEFMCKMTNENKLKVSAVAARIEKMPGPTLGKTVYAESQDATIAEPNPSVLMEEMFQSEEVAWRSEDYVDVEEPDEGDVQNDTGYTEAIPLILDGEETIFVRPSRHVTVFDEYSNKTSARTASSLTKGKTLVMINNAVHRTLADTIIERVEHHPKMFETVAFQRVWIEELRKGMDKNGDTPVMLLKKIQLMGSQIQTPEAIHFWRKGEVIGPLDKNDIKIIGQVYNDRSLLDNLDRVWAAIERIRAMHRRLAGSLRYLMPQMGVAYFGTRDTEDFVVDKELNLYLEDFKDAITLRKIVEIGALITIDVSRLNATLPLEVADQIRRKAVIDDR